MLQIFSFVSNHLQDGFTDLPDVCTFTEQLR